LNKEIKSINFDFPIYRYGYAGTGKTVIALKILQNLALADKQVLFTCYNKVLASDLKRLNKLSYNNALKFFENITIKDVHDLIVEYSPFGKIINETYVENTSSDFFESVVDGIFKSGYF
jgi:Cdc6-like AAA superfamily ATPase